MDNVVLIILLAFSAVTASSNKNIISFLEDIQKAEQFQSVFIFQKYEDDYFVKDVSNSLAVPVILSTDTSSFFVKRKFSSNLLAIITLHSTSDRDILCRLSESLRQMRSCKTIFLLNHLSKDEQILKELFSFCWENHMINVLATFRDFNNTSTYYRYTNFPTFSIEETFWKGDPPTDGYFPDRMRDLKGQEFPVIFGGSEPKMIISQDIRGEPVIAGYAGHFFQALAKKHNANLSKPVINKVLSAQQLLQLVLNQTIEVSAATTYADIPMDWFTYPYETLDWCLMLPIEPKIPIYEIFMIVFRWETLLITIGFIVILSALLESAIYLTGRKTSFLDYFFNDNCLRGALGQSFLEVENATYNIKFIYLLICLIGIVLVTSYDAFLQTYMTSPPSEKRIESFDDLYASGIKVYSLRPEYDMLVKVYPRFRDRYYEMFTFENDFAKYVKFRDSFNTKYSYMVNSVKWVIVQEQQRIFTRPLFRQPQGMCFVEYLQMVFPINENSIYKDIVNFLILETHSSGLLQFWQRKAFNELIETGKLKLMDLTSKPESVPLKVEDLQLIWVGLGVALVLATLCFVGEICFFKWKVRRQSEA